MIQVRKGPDDPAHETDDEAAEEPLFPRSEPADARGQRGKQHHAHGLARGRLVRLDFLVRRGIESRSTHHAPNE
jgi:hypothetical protein